MTRAVTCARALAALATLLGAGCADSTGGDLVQLPFSAGGAGSSAAAFTTPTGWDVQLDRAVIAAGPFYFNVSPPPTDEFRAGVVIVEATEQTLIDALDPTMHDVAGGADGETGSAVSVEIGLLPPDRADLAADPDDSALLGAGFAYVSGTASRAGSAAAPIAFAGAIAIDQTLVTPTEPLADLQRIRGAAVALTFTAAPQRLELRVDPTHWFDQTDFAALGSDGSWSVNSTFGAQLLQGVKGETGVYAFDLASQP